MAAMESSASMGDDNATDAVLEQLFRACDTKGTGFIGKQELRDLCNGMGIGGSDSDTLFADLDRDRDGRIDFADFASGFREHVIASPSLRGSVAENSNGGSNNEQLDNSNNAHETIHTNESEPSANEAVSSKFSNNNCEDVNNNNGREAGRDLPTSAVGGKTANNDVSNDDDDESQRFLRRTSSGRFLRKGSQRRYRSSPGCVGLGGVGVAATTQQLQKQLADAEDASAMWKDFLGQIGDNPLQSISADKLEELRIILQSMSSSPQLANCFEEVLKTLLNDVQRLQKDNSRLEEVYKTEKEKHESHLRQIEEEIDAHVSKIESKIKEQMREEAESEKRALQSKMDAEMSELQAHLKLFQTFDVLLKKDRSEEERLKIMNSKLEEASFENRKLRITLSDTQTNIALMHSELLNLRTQYEDKCRELHSERESAFEYIQDQDHMSRQLHLLHEANKRLQDVNDSIRNVMETTSIPPMKKPTSTSLPPRSIGGKRGSVIGDYLPDEHSLSAMPSLRLNFDKRLKTPLMSPADTEADSQYESLKDPSPRHLHSLQMFSEEEDMTGDNELSYGMKRFMEDLDSGLSTTRDLCTDTEDDPRVVSPTLLQRRLTNAELQKLERRQSNDEYEDIDLESPTGWAVLPVAQALTNAGGNGRNFGYSRSQSLIRTASKQSMIKRQMTRIATPDIAAEPNGPPDRMYKVVFAGDAAVGKTTFIVRISKGVFLPSVTSTLGVDFHVKTMRVDEKNVTLQLWDTAGQERFRSVTKSYFRRADGVMLLYDCTSEHSFLNVREWMAAIDDVVEKRIPIMICANKIDLRESALLQGKSIVRTDDGERLARDFSAIFIETSSKNGKNVVDALVQLTREMASNEDWEVQTSGLRITDMCASKKSGSCCSRKH